MRRVPVLPLPSKTWQRRPLRRIAAQNAFSRSLEVRVHGELYLLPERRVAVEIDGGDVAEELRAVFVHVAAAFGDAAHGMPEVENLLDVYVAVVAFDNHDLDVGVVEIPLHAGDALAA